MADYIEFPIETDPDELAQIAFDFIQTQWPDWVPNEFNLEVVLLQVIAQMAAENRDVASDVPVAIFRYFGETVMGIPPEEPAPAVGVSTWTMINDDGYTIPSGSYISVPKSGDENVIFEVINDVTIAPGETVTAEGEVEIRAIRDGAFANGLTGTATSIDTYAFVDDVTIVGLTTSGNDGQTEDEYLAALASELQLMTPRPIIPEDFAVLARKLAEVDRATAIDGYDPDTDTYDNERTIAIASIDVDGVAVSAPTKVLVEAYLEARREVNFIVNAIDPTFTAVNVSYVGRCLPLFDPDAVQAAVDASLASYLSAVNWGRVRSVEPVEENKEWRNEINVRYLEIAEVINRVDGFDYLETLALNGGTADVVLPGPAPLPEPGTITGIITSS